MPLASQSERYSTKSSPLTWTAHGKFVRDDFQPFLDERTIVPAVFDTAFTAPVAGPKPRKPVRARERASGELTTAAVNKLLSMGKRPQREITEDMAASCGMSRATYQALARNVEHWVVANNPGEIIVGESEPATRTFKRAPSNGVARSLDQRLDAQCRRWAHPESEQRRSWAKMEPAPAGVQLLARLDTVV